MTLLRSKKVNTQKLSQDFITVVIGVRLKDFLYQGLRMFIKLQERDLNFWEEKGVLEKLYYRFLKKTRMVYIYQH